MIVIKSKYDPPKNPIYQNSHLSTIIPGALKKYPIPPYKREKLELDDGDFLLLDWLTHKNYNEENAKNKDKLIIISHGLEGHSRRTYINSCADYFYNNGYSVLAWNQRSCGGEMNRLPSFYHVGLIEDINNIIKHAIKFNYPEIYLIGFSMGGIMSLNYVGLTDVDAAVKACIAFSTPLDLINNSLAMTKRSNYIYTQNFVNCFKRKLKFKMIQFPGLIDEKMIDQIKNIRDFDNYFTAPMFGFENNEDYYLKTSPLNILKYINVPTLIVNSENDPFLTEGSFLDNHNILNPNLFFEKPKYGGHIGFSLKETNNSWAEIRAKEFIESLT